MNNSVLEKFKPAFTDKMQEHYKLTKVEIPIIHEAFEKAAIEYLKNALKEDLSCALAKKIYLNN